MIVNLAAIVSPIINPPLPLKQIYINKCMTFTVFNFSLLHFHSDSLILKVSSLTP